MKAVEAQGRIGPFSQMQASRAVLLMRYLFGEESVSGVEVENHINEFVELSEFMDQGFVGDIYVCYHFETDGSTAEELHVVINYIAKACKEY